MIPVSVDEISAHIHDLSRDQLEGRPARLLRPRVVLYPLALALALGLLAFSLGTRSDADVTVLRTAGVPYTLGRDGMPRPSLSV